MLYGKYKVCDDVGDGPQKSAWPSEETVRKLFNLDAEEKTGHEKEVAATNSNVSHIPFVKLSSLAMQ
jgi:hypothetical protein